MLRSKNYIAVPPGETIREQIQNRGMSQKEFASRMEMTTKHISQLLNGEVRLTPDVAVRLEMVLGVPAKFWNNLEAVYREKIIKANAENEMDEDKEFSRKFPYNEMSKLGWVPETRKIEERVINLRRFFEVVRLGLITENGIPGIAYRRLGETEKGNYALMAWSQRAKIEARNIDVKPINVSKLEKNISYIRSMTMDTPEEFCPKLVDLLSECGIALVFLPHIKSTFLHGATFLDGKKIVVGLTVRGKDADRFWFSFFHEMGHIILGHTGLENGPSKDDEDEADQFAANTLVPSREFNEFVVKKGYLSQESIISFANRIGIDRGIVVGRLQNEGLREYNELNNLKTKYRINNS